MLDEQKKNLLHNQAVYNGKLGDMYDSVITLNRYRKKKHREHFKEIQQFMNVPITSVVDLGCGTGEFTLMLYDEFPDAVIYAVDVSMKMLRIFKDKLTPEQISRTRFIESDMESFLEDSSFFDMVVLSGSLHHMITWQNVLQLIAEKASILYLALEPGKITEYGRVKRFIYYSIGKIDNNAFVAILRHNSIDGADPNIGGGFCLDEIIWILKDFNVRTYPGVDTRHVSFYFLREFLGVNRHFSLLAWKDKQKKVSK